VVVQTAAKRGTRVRADVTSVASTRNSNNRRERVRLSIRTVRNIGPIGIAMSDIRIKA
jgi:hypothetical protein